MLNLPYRPFHIELERYIYKTRLSIHSHTSPESLQQTWWHAVGIWQLGLIVSNFRNAVNWNLIPNAETFHRNLSLNQPFKNFQLTPKVQKCSSLVSRGGCLSIKMSSYQHRDPHVEDKMVSRLSYLQHGNPHIWKDGLFYWDVPWSVSFALSKSWDICAANCIHKFPHHWPSVRGIHQ